MVFHWRLSGSKSPQVSRTLLSILTVFNNAIVWMVSTRPPTSKSSRPFKNPLVTVPKAPITIGIIVTFMFQSFFNSLARRTYLSRFSHSFSFILWSAGTLLLLSLLLLLLLLLLSLLFNFQLYLQLLTIIFRVFTLDRPMMREVNCYIIFYLYLLYWTLTWWLECWLMVREFRVQS